MPGFPSVYLDIYDKIAAKMTALMSGPSPAFKEVHKGWKANITTFPMCFVIPDPSAITPASTKLDKHVFRYIIAVITENANVEQGLRDAITLVGLAYDDLVSDRTLTNLADNLEAVRFEFHWRQAPGFIRHWAALFLEVYRFYV